MRTLAVNDLFRLPLELSNDPFYWNEAYSGDATDYADPDPGLVKIIDGLRPGRALDLDCGAGGLSIALAERKWQVTGIDIAAKAVEAARKVVQERGVNSELHLADATRWKPNRRYDLIVSSFAHPDSKAGRALAYRMIRDAIAPSGTVLLKDFDATVKRVKFFAAFDLVTVEELTAGFDSLNIWSINADNPMKYGLASTKEGELGIDGGAAGVGWVVKSDAGWAAPQWQKPWMWRCTVYRIKQDPGGVGVPVGPAPGQPASEVGRPGRGPPDRAGLQSGTA